MFFKGIFSVAAVAFGVWLIVVGAIATHRNYEKYSEKIDAAMASLLIVIGVIVASIPFCVLFMGV
ncbi:MAG: hypothetical protein K6C94_06235 [Candidatus Gastranaerophilales bacterium]|nr:hypothetical protein [Candidatus Gastranaerophilales bacterium]